MNKPFIQLHDDQGNWAFFVEERILDYKGRQFAVLTHTDENGENLSDESTLFEITEFDGKPFYSPVEDDSLIDEIELYLDTQMAH